MRRPAIALACAALAVTFATPANAAEPICNGTTGGPFDGSYLCVQAADVPITTIPVPYSVGSVCVAGVCTPERSGTLNVPVPDTQGSIGPLLTVYGSVCVPYKGDHICVPFSTANVLDPRLAG